MSDIEQWLTELDLGKYTSAFIEAEVGVGDLPFLTEDDLKELGLPLGPRRRIMAASQQPAEARSVGAIDRSEETPAANEAERRHLTVMFIDLAGSTAMSTRLDPEDMRDVMTAYQNTVAGVVARFEGFVAKYMGDGVLCYFGWPRAHEDDAERAVRAGLAIIEAVKKVRAPQREVLASRIGVATGVVIVGDLIGSGAAQEAAVVGDTPNLAARLQGLAQPDQLVLAPETRALIGNVFVLSELGAHELKGITGAVTAFAVTGESGSDSRFEARQTGALTAIVGREQELGLMTERWRKAAGGQGQMIVVSGEAGIGKSRITRALIDEVAADEHVRMTLQCSPYHADSPLHPIIQQMTHATGFASDDTADVRLDKLERLAGVDQANAGLLAAMLGIDGAARYGPLGMTPTQQRARTLAVLTDMLVHLSAERPLLVVFEDLHWIDPTSLELLDGSLDAIEAEKILILGTTRPTFEHGFGGHPVVSRFALNRLGREQIAAIVSKLTGGKALPAELLQVIAERTDGVPLYVEELTKTVLETGMLREEEHAFVLDRPLDQLAIPNSLHDSLMARLDRLQPIKEVAQMAACIGREFNFALLAGTSPLTSADLEAALDGLTKAELIFRRGLPPDASYLFKHALVRDAAYESLLKSRRQQIHARILAVLEQDSETTAEILAIHAQAAGLSERAVDLWAAAGKAALARPAYDEAISHLGQAIALLQERITAGDSGALERALDFQVMLGQALMARRGYAALETRTAWEQALDLVDRIGETPLHSPVLYGLWVASYVGGDHADALRRAEAMAELASSGSDSGARMVASRLVGTSMTMQGRFEQAQPFLDRAHDLYDPRTHGALANRYGQELGVVVNIYNALNLWLLGKTPQAEALAREAERIGLASGHINTICYMHYHLALLALVASDNASFERHSAAMAILANEHHLALWQDYGRMGRGLVIAGSGDKEGLEFYTQTTANFDAAGNRLYIPLMTAQAGWRALALGQPERASSFAENAHAMIHETGEAFTLADLHRLDGALALAADDPASAEASLRCAIEVAREQGGKFYELRAAIDLARLWQSQDRGDEASALLQPIHDSIEDGDCEPHRATAALLLGQR